MLATILKVCAGIVLALILLMTYTLLKAASMADDGECAESFEDWYQRTNKRDE